MIVAGDTSGCASSTSEPTSTASKKIRIIGAIFRRVAFESITFHPLRSPTYENGANYCSFN